MPGPTTTIDDRYSDPGSSATPWAETRRDLQRAEMFWLTTVRSDGRPHMTPLVAVWLDEAVYFCTGRDEQKSVNLRDNPHVILATGRGDWNGGMNIVVEGDAHRVTEPDRLRRLAKAWEAKWDGSWRYDVVGGVFRHAGGEAVVYGVAPTKVLSFGLGAFTHTRHQFG
ncbi:pyridoxamine 5'-phosphate oxidase [Antricoccus suffuscus]|uniref:Pyridoxamine 5'-phosphate oxidase n=1 Tax=Antricoccus suffuscus TaxID=1629062 RepID=A0A2T0ZWL6_9ACTN|nr:pyridoxamine 5'-phosphate oxidase family protein [Antricoccus suffuscus]PRZ40742.1 pyridoxamine 5'-phosphate oxidase [Antricoccus suffuscus]